MDENVCAALPVAEENSTVSDAYRLQRTLQAVLGVNGAGNNVTGCARDAATKIQYWITCISIELAEAYDWVIESGDAVELQYEAVDVLHFVFNVGAELGITEDYMAQYNTVYSTVKTYPVHDTAMHRRVAAASMRVLSAAKLLLDKLPWKTWRKYGDLDNFSAITDAKAAYIALVIAALELCAATGISTAATVDMFFAKHRENIRRQETGY